MTFIFSQHALQQIFKRNISIEYIKKTVLEGETIKAYDSDTPYPSKLNLLIQNNIPLHVVFAINMIEKQYIIITAYHPDSDIWDTDFKTKK